MNIVNTIKQAFNVVCFGVAVFWTLLMALVTIPLFLIRPTLGHKGGRLWGQGWCWLMGIRITVYGTQYFPALRGKGAVIAPNHQSMFDMPVLASLPINIKWISKKEIGYIPLVGQALRAMGSYFVTRDKSGRDLNVMKEVEDGLRAGNYVVIFPEGTRTRTGELLPLKKGAFRTALNANVPVIPVAISGTRMIAPPGKIPHRRGHRVFVRIGEPYHLADDKSLPLVIEDYKRRLVALLAENRSEAGV